MALKVLPQQFAGVDGETTLLRRPWRSECSAGTALAPKVLHVDVLTEPCIEQHIPSRMNVIVVHLNVVPVPTPIAAMIKVVRSYDPRGMVIEYHAPSTIIHGHEYEISSAALEVAIRIVAARFDVVFVVIPIAVLISILIVMFVPAKVAAAIMVFMFLVLVVAVLPGSCHGQGRRQG